MGFRFGARNYSGKFRPHFPGVWAAFYRKIHSKLPKPISSMLDQLLGLRGALIGSVVVFVISVFGHLDAIDYRLLGELTAYRLQDRPSDRVLLVSVPGAVQLSRNEWTLVCSRLANAGSGRIMTAFPLTDEMVEGLFSEECREKLIVGLPLPERKNDRAYFDEKVSLINARNVHFGVVDAAATGAAFGEFPSTIDVGGKAYPVFERLPFVGGGLRIPEGVITDFRIRPELIPEIGIQQILRDGVVDNLVRDRVVIIGQSASIFSNTLQIPGYSQPISLLSYEGMLIHSLATASWYSRVSVAIATCVYIALGCLLWLALQPLSMRPGMALVLSALCGDFALMWAGIAVGGIWLPIAPLVMLQICIFFAVFRDKAVRDLVGLHDIAAQISAKIQRRIIPENILEAKEHWLLLARLIDQTLNLSRSIFLERVAGDHRLKEIISLRCGISDIDEKRRDYERTPYTLAIAENSAIEVEHYLTQGAANERQFLSPLLSGGEVMGFWVFGIDETHMGDASVLISTVNSMSSQLAELLYHRKMANLREEKEDESWVRYFEDASSNYQRSIRHCIGMLEFRLSSLEYVFNLQENPAVAYDLFGRVMLSNSKLRELLANEGLLLNEMTASDLISALSGRAIEDARQWIRELIFEQKSISLPVFLKSHPDKRFLLVGKSLKSDEVGGTNGFTFDANGIFFEFIDISEVVKISAMRTSLMEQLGYKLSNHLESVILALHMLAQNDINPVQKTQIINIGEKAVNSASGVLRKVQRLLGPDIIADKTSQLPFPLDPVQILRRKLADLSDYFDSLRISLHFRAPEMTNLVLARPDALEQVFEKLLRMLAEDTEKGGEIMIVARYDHDFFEVRCTTKGFGIYVGNASVHATGSDPSPKADSRLSSIVSEWGGSLALSSKVGVGSTAELRLRSFWEC